MHVYRVYFHFVCRQQPQAARLLQSELFTAVQQYTAAAFGKADPNDVAAHKQLRNQMRAPSRMG